MKKKKKETVGGASVCLRTTKFSLIRSSSLRKLFGRLAFGDGVSESMFWCCCATTKTTATIGLFTSPLQPFVVVVVVVQSSSSSTSFSSHIRLCFLLLFFPFKFQINLLLLLFVAAVVIVVVLLRLIYSNITHFYQLIFYI